VTFALASTQDGDYARKMTSTSDLNNLMAQLMSLRDLQGHAHGLPPVERWNPAICGDIGMEIRADGSWWHEGTRITRQPLIDLFATILRKDEDGQTWLVTPTEKITVKVQDAHFLGNLIDEIETSLGKAIAVTTNVGDLVVIGPEHPLRVLIDAKTGEPRPYVRVRGRLDARILRAPFYELVALSNEVNGQLTIKSQGIDFVLGDLEGSMA
jgi:uncharacterized protein